MLQEEKFPVYFSINFEKGRIDFDYEKWAKSIQEDTLELLEILPR